MIHLVQPPFATITQPSLALGVMKAQLAEAGISAQVHHFNLDFARMIGAGAFEVLARFKGVETQVAEWLFAREAWDREFGLDEDRFLDSCGEELTFIPHVTDQRAWLRKVRGEVVPAFLDHCVATLESMGPPTVVGFSCTFFQTLAALAIGRRLRARHPAVRLVYGGACFHGEMGEELIGALPFIDAVSTGEADDVLVPLFQALQRGEPPTGLQGVLYRSVAGGPVEAGPPASPVSAEVLEALPAPDFDDFFHAADRVGFSRANGYGPRVRLPFEASRGCWWGQKHHCTFCGLNGEGMTYRSRTSERSYEILRQMAARYPSTPRIQATDNILPRDYFYGLLPRLEAEPLGLELFWEIKPNLRHDQIRQLARAGVRYVQPGIESLSDNILKQMRKGVTGLQNVYLLRVCQEEGIIVLWNNLIRIPGERREDYERMARWFPLLAHLRAPSGGSPKVECHRFSPYFSETDRWAHNLRPMAWYAGLYPQDAVDLGKVAYYFDADWHDVLGGSAYDEILQISHRWTDLWRDGAVLPELRILEVPPEGGVRILDTREGQPGEWLLTPAEAAVYASIETPSTARRVLETLTAAGSPLPEEQVQAALTTLCERGLALFDDRQYLALALFRTHDATSPYWRRHTIRPLTNQQPVGPAAA